MKPAIALVLIPVAVIVMVMLLLFSESDDLPQAVAVRSATAVARPPATVTTNETIPTPKPRRSVIVLPEDDATLQTALQPQPTESVARDSANETQDTVDWVSTSYSIAQRLGTPGEQFAGAIYELGKFVHAHSIDIDALDQNQLACLSDRFGELWNRRVQEIRSLSESHEMAMLNDSAGAVLELDQSLIEATKANYRELENCLAREFRRGP